MRTGKAILASLLVLASFALLPTVFPGTASAGAVYGDQSRSMYVWSGADYLGDGAAQTQARNALANFCVANGITEIFYGAAPELAKIAAGGSDYDLHKFVGRMHNAGVKVHAVGGENTWLDDPQGAVDFLNNARNYNEAATNPNHRFDAIHYDVEPWALGLGPVWYQQYGSAYKNLIDAVYAANNGYFILGFSISAWLDNAGHDYTALNEYVQDRSDYVSIMAYRDTAAMIESWAQGEVGYADQHGKKVVVSVTTNPPNPPGTYPYNTFGDDTLAYMHGELATVEADFAGHAGFVGIGIQAYSHYKNMQ